MEFYSSEKEQVEALRKWWSENWSYIVTGLALGVLAVVGYNQYQAYVLERAQQASNKYSELVTVFATDAIPAAESILAELKSDYSSTPYAVDGALYAAGVYVENSELESAAGELRWVINESDDPSKVALAKTRLARVLIAMSEYQAAIDELRGLNESGFSALASEIQGDAYRALGDVESARAAYALALEQGESQPFDRDLVQLKLDNLDRETLPREQTEAEPAENSEDTQ